MACGAIGSGGLINFSSQGVGLRGARFGPHHSGSVVALNGSVDTTVDPTGSGSRRGLNSVRHNTTIRTTKQNRARPPTRREDVNPAPTLSAGLDAALADPDPGHLDRWLHAAPRGVSTYVAVARPWGEESWLPLHHAAGAREAPRGGGPAGRRRSARRADTFRHPDARPSDRAASGRGRGARCAHAAAAGHRGRGGSSRRPGPLAACGKRPGADTPRRWRPCWTRAPIPTHATPAVARRFTPR